MDKKCEFDIYNLNTGNSKLSINWIYIQITRKC